MGAIAGGGVMVINDDVARGLGISPEVAEREGDELLRREQAYREGRPFPEVTGKVVIVVDDGLATGSSMRAGVTAEVITYPGGGDEIHAWFAPADRGASRDQPVPGIVAVHHLPGWDEFYREFSERLARYGYSVICRTVGENVVSLTERPVMPAPVPSDAAASVEV